MVWIGSNNVYFIFFFKQKTAYEMRISDWSSDVCSSDLMDAGAIIECRPAITPIRSASMMIIGISPADELRRSAPDEGEQVGVELVLMCLGKTVGCAGIDFQRRVRHELR